MEILFVGNSYTYHNGLPDMLESLSAALSGPLLRTEAHTHGAWSLRDHLDDGHVAALLAEGAPGGTPWSRVVLQEQSTLGGGPMSHAEYESGTLQDPARFQAATRELAELIEEAGSEPLLFMTWAKARFPDQTSGLASAYSDAAAMIGAPVAPVGLAWAKARRDRPDLVLYVDGSHPSPAGSYLAACVLYAQLTGLSPEGAPAHLNGRPWGASTLWVRLRRFVASREAINLVSLDDATALYLQQLAWEVVTSGGPG